MALEQRPDEMNELEQLLQSFRPQAGRLSVPQLMYQVGFEAGRRQVRPRSASRWIWPVSTAAMTAVAAVLGGLLLFGSPPPVGQPAVAQPAEQTLPKELPPNAATVATPAADADVQRAAPPPKLARDSEIPTSGRANSGDTASSSHRPWLPPLSASGTAGQSNYIQTRNAVVAFGIDALPISPIGHFHTESSPRSYAEWQRALLDGETNP